MMASAQADAPINLHWWRGVPNFGDAINPLIVAYVSGAKIKHSTPRDADMFAIGSMLQVVKRSRKEVPDDRPPVNVWGTGLLNPVFGLDFLDKVALHLVRGPITAALLKLKLRRFGDPGLLIDSALPFTGEKTDRIGIVPHHNQIDAPDVLAFAKSDPAFMLIDPRNDAQVVCQQIASCAGVLSGSLHGLIVADSYGVPNRWISPDQEWLKYHDYAASVGRTDMLSPLAFDEAPNAKFDKITYNDGINAAREALLDTFPEHLKSSAARA